ncbi:aldo/keto reductase [Bacteroidota bacterium]
MKRNTNSVKRRAFLKQSAVTTAGLVAMPYLNLGKIGVENLMTRPFGKLGFEVTTFGLGGQSSLQWTPKDIDPVPIILKAFEKGVNYFDTSNLYGPSQMNYGKAFRELDLIPGKAGYNEKLRKSMWLTSKTHLRWAKGLPSIKGVTNWSQGEVYPGTVADIKRSLSQMFGDGKGNYPKGAYLDLILIHNMNTMDEVDALFTGLHDTDPKAEYIGALAVLRDFRDGTNLTGLNPEEEKLVKHIGFSGHYSAPVMMEMIQRDKTDVLEAMLIAINSNDRLCFNMQHNAIPVATAKNMGVVAMKIFADGAMYSKEANWSNNPTHVVRSVGSPDLPSRPLIEYAMSVPGIHTGIIGIGVVDDDSKKCQLTQNISAAQVNPGGLSRSDMESVEKLTEKVKGGKTNYFQIAEGGLSAVQNLIVTKNGDWVRINWDTAFAGQESIERYDILKDGNVVGRIRHQPQTTKDPFVYEVVSSDESKHAYQVIAADEGGEKAGSKIIMA